jgi:hypothetical protein
VLGDGEAEGVGLLNVPLNKMLRGAANKTTPKPRNTIFNHFFFCIALPSVITLGNITALNHVAILSLENAQCLNLV